VDDVKLTACHFAPGDDVSALYDSIEFHQLFCSAAVIAL
jgi:hypothetical protein